MTSRNKQAHKTTPLVATMLGKDKNWSHLTVFQNGMEHEKDAKDALIYKLLSLSHRRFTVIDCWFKKTMELQVGCMAENNHSFRIKMVIVTWSNATMVSTTHIKCWKISNPEYQHLYGMHRRPYLNDFTLTWSQKGML